MHTSSLSPLTSPSSCLPLTAYSAHVFSGQLWKIKNARYRSTFMKPAQPSAEDFRNHIKYISDPHFTSAVSACKQLRLRLTSNSFSQYGPDHLSPTCELPLRIQYSQVFCHLTELLDKYQNCISEISPLEEEDLLFLLLRRFANSSGATVYVEIKRSGDLQIYDSTIQEPLVGWPKLLHNSVDAKLQESMILEGSLSHDTNVIHADLSMDYSKPREVRSSDEAAYTPLPQTPSAVDTTCTVTVNFPAVMSTEPTDDLDPPINSAPEYSSPAEGTGIWQEHDWTQLPVKFQPPSFRIHRCHHEGVERGGEDEAFELPLGFPETVQHMEEACSEVFNTLN